MSTKDRFSIPDVLVCPVCKGPLLASRGENRFELVCPSCAAAYEVRAGTPNMKPDAARPLAPEEARRWREKRRELTETPDR